MSLPALGRAAILAGLLTAGIPAAADPTCMAIGMTPTESVPVSLAGGRLVTDGGAEVVLAGLASFPTDPAAAGDVAALLVPGDVPAPLRLVPTAPPDRYGRTAGLVFDSAGGLLQARLVRDGVALVRPDGIDDACARALLALEAGARSAGIGLWADSSSRAKATDPASLFARNGLYALVEGRIVSIGYGSRMVFLDFGRRFRTDFTVMVQQPLVSRLREAGIPVESLTERVVRVRGIIEESGGPAIRLASPLALELVDETE